MSDRTEQVLKEIQVGDVILHRVYAPDDVCTSMVEVTPSQGDVLLIASNRPVSLASIIAVQPPTQTGKAV